MECELRGRRGNRVSRQTWRRAATLRAATLRATALAAGPLFSATRIAGATAYWDIDGGTSGAGGAAPGGAWESSFWSSDPAGAVATTTWTSGDSALFSSGTGASG